MDRGTWRLPTAVAILSAFLAGMGQGGETLYPQAVAVQLGEWQNLDRLLGPPDGQYAYTAGTQAGTPHTTLPTSAAWLDLGRHVEAGTVVVYLNDPGALKTCLSILVWGGSPPAQSWDASDTLQGTGRVTWRFAARSFRYIEILHWTSDTGFQDGVDAIAVITGEPAQYGNYLDPPPATTGPPIYGCAQLNNGLWSNPGYVLGPPDGNYAWSANPSHTMPRMMVDLGRVVSSGVVEFVHAKPYPLLTGLQVAINAEEVNPDPNVPPGTGPNDPRWLVLTTGTNRSSVVRLEFPPTRFRYVFFAQSQTSPGQEDGIDAVWVYESPSYQFAPGKIAFSALEGGQDEIWTIRPDGTERTNITGTSDFIEIVPKWSPNGTRFLFAGKSVGAPATHLYTMSSGGGPRTPLTETLGMVEERSDWSPDGSRVAFGGLVGSQSFIYVMNVDGTGLTRLTSGPVDLYPSWSPDGKKIAFARALTPGQPIGHWQIFTIDVNTKVEKRLTMDDANDNMCPAWSPDGSQIAFHSTRNGNWWREQLWLTTPDGAAQTQLTSNSWRNASPSWSPDSKQIAFVRAPYNTWNNDIWTVNVADRTEFQVTNTPGLAESYPDWSAAEAPSPDTTPPVLACPGDMAVAQTRPDGAVVEFTCPATDDQDPYPTVVCVPPSGSVFPLGTTMVVCTATDASGNTARRSFRVTVGGDVTPPVLVCPSDMVVQQETLAGSVVSFQCTATDDQDPNPTVACDPPSGSLFPLGATDVTCTARDAVGNTSQRSFRVTVVDLVPPGLTCPTDMSLMQTTAGGAVASFECTVRDDCDAAPTVVWSPPSGSTFPLGTTTVTCTATDASGNRSQGSFKITVIPSVSSRVSYRIQCNKTLMAAYVANRDSGERGQSLPGTPVDYPTALTGSTNLFPVGRTVYIHLWGTAYWEPEGFVVANFVAPPGYGFLETGSRYLVTSTAPWLPRWTASVLPWDDPWYWPEPVMAVDWENDPAYAPGTERVWMAPWGTSFEGYFSCQATLVPMPMEIEGAPLPFPPGPEPGFSTLIVKSTSAISNVNDAAIRLACYRPNAPDHDVSAVTTVPALNIEKLGAKNYPAGVVGIVAPERINFAMRHIGCIYVNQPDHLRTFLVSSDDGYLLFIGDTLVSGFFGGRGLPSAPDAVAVRFPAEGFYPIRVEWFQGTGNTTLEVSSREGVWTADDWEADPNRTWNFPILGADPAFRVYQCPPWDSPIPTDVGPNEVTSAPAYAGAVATPGDGLRVQVTQPRASSPGSMADAIAYVDSPDRVPSDFAGDVVRQQFDFDDPGGGPISGSFPGAEVFPGLSPTVNNNNFVTRISGLIHIPSAGDYSFSAGSDDGCSLFIGRLNVLKRAAGAFAANFGFARFLQPGLYPLRLYHIEYGGRAALEFSQGGSMAAGRPQLLVQSDNPAMVGFSKDFGGRLYTATPFGSLSAAGLGLKGAAFVRVPALGLTIRPDQWTLQRRQGGTTLTLMQGSNKVGDLVGGQVREDLLQSFPAGSELTLRLVVEFNGENLTTPWLDLSFRDETAPVITCPGGLSVEQQDEAGTIVRFPYSATDDTDPNPIVVCVPPSGGTFPPGTTTVTCTATDASGNTATYSFTVTVLDTTPPVLVAPPDVTAEQTAPAGTPAYIGQATATDICDPNVTVANDAPAVFPLGETVVTWTATDGSGNVATATQTVTVVDTTPPSLAMPEDIVVEQTSAAGAPVAWTCSATDICDANVDVICNLPSGTVFPLGTTTVTCTATDDSGNKTIKTFAVTVVDTTPPELVVPHPITVEQATAEGTHVEWACSATDICDGALDIACVPPSGTLFALGTTTVTCRATDDSGNKTTKTFTVKVVDTTPPELVVPEPITVEQTSAEGTPVEWTCSANDICDADPTVVCDPPSGSTFPLGTTPVTCTATDDSGNAATKVFTVTVVDTTPPMLIVPDPIVVEQATADGTTVTWPECVAIDICDAEVDVVCKPASGSIFPLGVTTVTCTATDESGNQTVKSFNVTVVDTTPPVIESPWAKPNMLWSPNHKMVDIAIGAVVNDICDAAPTWEITGVASNEPANGLGDGDTAPDWEFSGQSLKLRAERSGKGSGRVYTITIQATDASGNAATAEVTVAVPHDKRR